MIVLDASAAIELVLGTRTGHRVADRLSTGDRRPHAPHLLSVEVAQTLRRFAGRGQISPTEGRDALDVLTRLNVSQWEHAPLLRRAWELRDNVTAYDAMYIALAEGLGAPLLTTDTRLARASGHHALVEVITA